MFCTKCGKQHDGTSDLCPSCENQELKTSVTVNDEDLREAPDNQKFQGKRVAVIVALFISLLWGAFSIALSSSLGQIVMSAIPFVAVFVFLYLPWQFITVAKLYMMIVPIVISFIDVETILTLLDSLKIVAIVTMIVLIGLYNSELRLRKKDYNVYKCPKCRDKTKHNRYGICTKCYFDKDCFLGTCAFSIIVCAFLAFTLSFDRYWIISIFMLTSVLWNIYMYPALMAKRTEQPAAVAIFWLNLLFGFTGIMWLILLIWGSSGNGLNKTSNNTKIDIHLPENLTQNPAPQKSTLENFEELKKLHDMGMLSDEEFENKRKEYVSRL